MTEYANPLEVMEAQHARISALELELAEARRCLSEAQRERDEFANGMHKAAQKWGEVSAYAEEIRAKWGKWKEAFFDHSDHDAPNDCYVISAIQLGHLYAAMDAAIAKNPAGATPANDARDAREAEGTGHAPASAGPRVDALTVPPFCDATRVEKMERLLRSCREEMTPCEPGVNCALVAAIDAVLALGPCEERSETRATIGPLNDKPLGLAIEASGERPSAEVAYAAQRPDEELRAVATELLRLYDWRNEIGRVERDFNHDRKQVKTWLNQYGREKKAAWFALRAILVRGDVPPPPLLAIPVEWLEPGAVVPVDAQTTGHLLRMVRELLKPPIAALGEMRDSWRRLAEWISVEDDEFDPLVDVGNGYGLDQAKQDVRALLRASPPVEPSTVATPDLVIKAQHDETGRMWTGPRSQIPPRYREVP